jgi:hypothetical protein
VNILVQTRSKFRKEAADTEYFSFLSDDDGAALANKLTSNRLHSEDDAQLSGYSTVLLMVRVNMPKGMFHG